MPATLTPARALPAKAQLALRMMKERGSLTADEARALGCGSRLAARVLEIKEAYGESSVADEWVTVGRVRVKAYRFVGLTDPQGDLGL